MRKHSKKNLYTFIGMLLAFVLWTVIVRFADVKAIGAQQSSVGLSTVNGFVHKLTGINMLLYNITDWLGLVPIFFALGFAFLGLIQWIKRKSIKKVDSCILVLGGFYIVVMAVYFLFEKLVINYRPVLIDGFLEASYPSSTTMLVLCVMSTAIMQFDSRIKNNGFKRIIKFSIIVFMAFMVIGRLISGVHWFTDIVGGIIISTALVMLYCYINKYFLSET